MDATLADIPAPVFWIIAALVIGLAIAPPFMGGRCERREPPDDWEPPDFPPSGE